MGKSDELIAIRINKYHYDKGLRFEDYNTKAVMLVSKDDQAIFLQNH